MLPWWIPEFIKNCCNILVWYLELSKVPSDAIAVLLDKTSAKMWNVSTNAFYHYRAPILHQAMQLVAINLSRTVAQKSAPNSSVFLTHCADVNTSSNVPSSVRQRTDSAATVAWKVKRAVLFACSPSWKPRCRIRVKLSSSITANRQQPFKKHPSTRQL